MSPSAPGSLTPTSDGRAVGGAVWAPACAPLPNVSSSGTRMPTGPSPCGPLFRHFLHVSHVLSPLDRRHHVPVGTRSVLVVRREAGVPRGRLRRERCDMAALPTTVLCGATLGPLRANPSRSSMRHRGPGCALRRESGNNVRGGGWPTGTTPRWYTFTGHADPRQHPRRCRRDLTCQFGNARPRPGHRVHRRRGRRTGHASRGRPGGGKIRLSTRP